MIDVRRLAPLTAALAALCALGAGPALAGSTHHHKRVGACNAHRKQATKRTAKVIVYGKNTGTDEDSGAPVTTYYACLRPAGKSAPIGSDVPAGGEYPGNVEMSELGVAGTYVTALSSSGWASAAACAKYEGDNPVCSQQISWWIEALDARTRRGIQIRLGTGTSGADKLVVSSAGAVAWLVPNANSNGETLQAMVLRRGGSGHLSGTVQTLDSGAIGSLRFNGLTLNWTAAGAPKLQTLHQ